MSSGEGLYDPAPGTLVVSFISGNFYPIWNFDFLGLNSNDSN